MADNNPIVLLPRHCRLDFREGRAVGLVIAFLVRKPVRDQGQIRVVVASDDIDLAAAGMLLGDLPLEVSRSYAAGSRAELGLPARLASAGLSHTRSVQVQASAVAFAPCGDRPDSAAVECRITSNRELARIRRPVFSVYFQLAGPMDRELIGEQDRLELTVHVKRGKLLPARQRRASFRLVELFGLPAYTRKVKKLAQQVREDYFAGRIDLAQARRRLRGHGDGGFLASLAEIERRQADRRPGRVHKASARKTRPRPGTGRSSSRR